jgi:hypothetical protein
MRHTLHNIAVSAIISQERIHRTVFHCTSHLLSSMVQRPLPHEHRALPQTLLLHRATALSLLPSLSPDAPVAALPCRHEGWGPDRDEVEHVHESESLHQIKASIVCHQNKKWWRNAVMHLSPIMAPNGRNCKLSSTMRIKFCSRPHKIINCAQFKRRILQSPVLATAQSDVLRRVPPIAHACPDKL